MNQEILNKLIKLKIRSIFLLFGTILTLIVLIVYKFSNNNNNYNNFKFSLIISMIVIISIAQIVNNLYLLITNWKNDKLNKEKIIWGIIGILFLKNISPIIFAIRGIKIYKNNIEKFDENNHNI